MKMFLLYWFIDENKVEVLCYFLYEDVFFKQKIGIQDYQKIMIILKGFGVKLLDILLLVCDSIEKVGIIIIKFNLDSLISFLKFLLCYIRLLIGNGQLELKMLFLKIFDNVYFCIEYCMKSGNFSNDLDGLLLCLLEIGYFVKFSVCLFVLLILFLELILSLKLKLLYFDLYKLF